MRLRYINFQKILAATVLFISAWNTTLPIASATEIPWFLRPIQVIYGISIEQFIFILILPSIILTNQFKYYSTNRYTYTIAILFWFLGIDGIFSNCFNFVNLFEIGEAIRLILFGFFLIWLERCAKRFGIRFCFNCVIFGLTMGGTVNIYFSFQINNGIVGILPLLIGQAGPGPPLGLLVIICAIAFSITKKTFLKVIYIFACLIGVYGGIASWSKISLLIIAVGLIPWSVLIICELIKTRFAKFILTLFICSIVLLSQNNLLFSETRDSVYQIISTKLSSEDHDLDDPDSKIWGERFVFHIAVLEIVARHPILGVGYAGFGAAFKETDASKMKHAYVDESDQIQSSQANPHSTWLYYASANGLPGFVIVFFLMLNISIVVYKSCQLAPHAGRTIGSAMITAIFIWSISVPDILQSCLLLSLVGIACATPRRTAYLAVQMKQDRDEDPPLMRN